MLEIPQLIWKKIEGYTRPQRVYRTNHENVLCWQTVRRAGRKKVVIKLFEWDIVEETNAEIESAQALMKMDHPHLVKVLDVQEDEELGVYYVMEYWGEDLRETMKAPFRQDWVIEVIKQVLEGVSELHRHNLVHRDIKPENIFIKSDIVKLGDYGLVKSQRWITELTTIAGTRDYMAPEILEGRSYDKRCDIYSIGIVFLELLTAEREIPARKSDDIIDSLWEIIIRATAKKPDERFDSIDGLIVAIHEFLEWELKRKAAGRVLKKMSKEKQKVGTLTSKPKIESKLPQPINQSLDIRRRTPDIDRSRRKIEPGVLVRTLQTQFDTVSRAADTDKALKIGGELLQAVEQRFGPKDPHVADVLDALAELDLRKGNYPSARELYHRSLAIDTETFGRPSIEMIRSLFNEAKILLRQSRFDVSIGTYQQALLVAQQVLGKNHPHIAVILNNLASAYYGCKDYAKAQELYQQALRINEKKFGRNHETVAVTLYNLALTYEAMDKKETAEPLYRRAAEIGEKVFKPEDERFDKITWWLNKPQ